MSLSLVCLVRQVEEVKDLLDGPIIAIGICLLVRPRRTVVIGKSYIFTHIIHYFCSFVKYCFTFVDHSLELGLLLFGEVLEPSGLHCWGLVPGLVGHRLLVVPLVLVGRC